LSSVGKNGADALRLRPDTDRHRKVWLPQGNRYLASAEKILHCYWLLDCDVQQLKLRSISRLSMDLHCATFTIIMHTGQWSANL